MDRYDLCGRDIHISDGYSWYTYISSDDGMCVYVCVCVCVSDDGRDKGGGGGDSNV